jgi:hypothetical protein
VNLGGAPPVLDQNFEPSPAATCTTLNTGTTVTLLRASGGITGSLVVNGQPITQGGSATEPILNYCNEPEANAIIHYNANSITATIAGAPVASTTAPKITGTATVGNTLTVSDNGSWTAVPAPSYSYKWESCSGGICSPISGATSSSYTLTSAELGKTVEVQVTATNSYGSASALSNSLGPVTGTTSSAGGSSGGGSSGGGSGGTTISGALRAQIRADLRHLGHPHGRRAVLLMLKRGYYRTRFHARARGTLSDVWRTTVRTGHGKHARRHTFVVARATVHAKAGRRVSVKIHLTAAGRRLLRRHLLSLHITARERFLVAGSGWISVTARFTL